MSIHGLFIEAGDLRETVLIQSLDEEQDASGGVFGSWETDLTLRAKVEPVRGMEAARLAQADASSDIRVFVRYQSSGVTTKQRLVWRTRDFDIQSVHEVGAERRWLELMCVEHQTDG